MQPKNPNEIIIQNKFYPGGLSEIDVWNYYQKNMNSILEQLRSRAVILFLKVKDNIIVLRNKKKKPIKVNLRNFDDIITGRTLSIHGVMKNSENFGIVDIDTDNFKKSKEAVFDCYEILSKSSFMKNVEVRFTGKTSFHLIGNFHKKMKVDNIRYLLKNELKILEGKYSISKTRKSNLVNIDLFRNVKNAGYILENSLSVIGLKCMRIKIGNVKNFKKLDAMI